MEVEEMVANKCYDSQFSEKISILVVDDDTTCLLIASALLKKEKHKVVTVKNAKDALRILRISGSSFDLVLTDVHMPEMNGFQLQQQIIKEFDIPIAFMSADEKESTVIKGLEIGGVCFTLKPISQDDISDLWQYATRRKEKMSIGKSVLKIQENTNKRSPHEVTLVESLSMINEKDNKLESNKNGKFGRKHERAKNQDDLSTSSKKSKLVWTDFLHNRFLEAITKLGLSKAHPRRILEAMDIPELTRGNVASHLQKYRDFLKKVTTPVNTSPQLISNFSKIAFGNANKLSTRNHLLINATATSGQQLMIGNLDYVAGAETHHQGIDQKKKEFVDMLAHQINQKYHNIEFGNMKSANLSTGGYIKASVELPSLPKNFVSIGFETGAGARESGTNDFSVLGNNYPTPNSNVLIISVLDNQLKVQSSNMENNNIEEGTTLSFIDDNNQYQQVCFSWNGHTLAEQENYENITTEEKSFQFHDAPPNSEFEQENCESVTVEERSIQLHNAPLYLEHEQGNYESITAEERSSQFHNAFLNSEHEQENYEDVTGEERSFQFCNSFLNLELEQENYRRNTAEERPLQLDHVPPNSKLEQGNYGRNTTKKRPLQLDHVSPKSKLEQEKYGGTTAEKSPFHLHI